MKPIPPFIANSEDDTHCVNAVLRMVLKHYKDTDLTWKEIDAVTKAIPGKGTWTVCGAIELAKRGIHVTNIEPVDYEILHRDGVGYLEQIFGPQTAAYYQNKSNIAAVIPDIPEFLRLVPHEMRRASTEEITSLLQNGNLIGATINSAILNNRSGFALHYVLIYDFDGTHLTLHDPGLPPAPSRKLTTSEFEACFLYPGGNGGIEVFHK